MSHERYSKGFERRIRTVKSEFRKNHDINSYPDVREFLSQTIPHYEDVYARFDNVFHDWHSVRLQIGRLDPSDKNYMTKARELGKNFIDTYENPKSKDYVEDLLVRLSPVLSQITNLVIANRDSISPLTTNKR